MKIKISERGQALVMIVLAIIGLMGITGLTIDGGAAYMDRRHAQNSADAAVMASALAKIRGQNIYNAALNRAADNGYANDGVQTALSSIALLQQAVKATLALMWVTTNTSRSLSGRMSLLHSGKFLELTN